MDRGENSKGLAARNVVGYWAVWELGISGTEVTRRLKSMLMFSNQSIPTPKSKRKNFRWWFEKQKCDL